MLTTMSPDPAPLPAATAWPHVVAVDDDAAIRALLVDYLSGNELRVSAVASGRAWFALRPGAPQMCDGARRRSVRTADRRRGGGFDTAGPVGGGHRVTPVLAAAKRPATRYSWRGAKGRRLAGRVKQGEAGPAAS